MSLRRTKRSSASSILRKSRSDFRLSNDWISKAESGYDDADEGNPSDIGADLRSIGNKYDKLVLKMFNQRSNVRNDFLLIRKEAKSLRNELKFLIMKHDGSTAFKKGYKPESHGVERVVKAEVVTKEMGQLEIALADLMAKYYYLLEQTKTLKDVNSLWHIRSVMKSDLSKRGLKIGGDESGAFRSDLRSPIVNRDVDDIKSENSVLIQKVRWLNKLSQEFRADLGELISAKVALLNSKVSLEKEYDLANTHDTADSCNTTSSNYVENFRQTELRIVDGLKRRIAALDRISDALKVAMIKIGFKDIESGILDESSVCRSGKPAEHSFQVKQVVENEFLSSDNLAKDSAKVPRSADSHHDSSNEEDAETVQVRYVRIEDVDENDLQCLSPKSKRRFTLFSKEGAVYGDLNRYPTSAISSEANEEVKYRDELEEDFCDDEESLSESRLVWCRSDECDIDRSDSDITLTEDMNISCMELTDESLETESRETKSRETESHVTESRDVESCDVMSRDVEELKIQACKTTRGTLEHQLHEEDFDSKSDETRLSSSQRFYREKNYVSSKTEGAIDENKPTETSNRIDDNYLSTSVGATRQDRFAKAKNYFISYCYSESASGKPENMSGDKSLRLEQCENTRDNRNDKVTEEGRIYEEQARMGMLSVCQTTNLAENRHASSVQSEETRCNLKDQALGEDTQREEHSTKTVDGIEAISIRQTISSLEERCLGLGKNDKSRSDPKNETSNEDVRRKETAIKADEGARPISVLQTVSSFENKQLGPENSEKDTELFKIKVSAQSPEQKQELDSKPNINKLELVRSSDTDPKEEQFEQEKAKTKHERATREQDESQRHELRSKQNASLATTSTLGQAKKPIFPEDRPVYYNPDGVWPSTPKSRRPSSVCRSNTFDRRSREKSTKPVPEKTKRSSVYVSRDTTKHQDFSSSTLPRSLKAARSPKKPSTSQSPIPRIRPRSTVVNAQKPNEAVSYTLPRNNTKTRIERSKSCVGDTSRPTSRLSKQWNTTTSAKPSPESRTKTGKSAGSTSTNAKVSQNDNVCNTLPRGMKIGRRDSVSSACGDRPDSRPSSRLRKSKITTAGALSSPEKQRPIGETEKGDRITSVVVPRCKKRGTDDKKKRSSLEIAFDASHIEHNMGEGNRDSWVVLDNPSAETQDSKQTTTTISITASYNNEQRDEADHTAVNLPKKSKSTSDAVISSCDNFEPSGEPNSIIGKFNTLPKTTAKCEPLDQNLNMLSINEAGGKESSVKKKKRKLIIKRKRPDSSINPSNNQQDTKQHEDKKHVSRVDLITGKAASWMQSALRLVSSDSKGNSKSSAKARSASQARPEGLAATSADITRPVSSMSSKRGSVEYRKSMIPVPAAI